jgi:hypothetical protein
MSAEPPFRCPVCRATQPLSETCRRCQADLRLVMRARLRLAYVKRQRVEAIASGDRVREQIWSRELRWLAPRGS